MVMHPFLLAAALTSTLVLQSGARIALDGPVREDGGMVTFRRGEPGVLLDAWWGKPEQGERIHNARAAVSPDAAALLCWPPKGLGEVPHVRMLSTATEHELHNCAGAVFFGTQERARLLVVGGRKRAWSVLGTDLTPLAGPEKWRGEYEQLVPIAAEPDPKSDEHWLVLAVDSSRFDDEAGVSPVGGCLAHEEDAPGAAALGETVGSLGLRRESVA